MKAFYILVIVITMFAQTTYAQIPVAVTNPSNTTPNLLLAYTSLAEALTALNSVTSMTGPVILTVTAGTYETTPRAGLTIGSPTLNPVLTAVNTITIICSGGTATLNAGTGTSTPSSASPDGILKIAGANFIIIDGLTFTDGNTTNPATMEFGIALFKLNASDGAQYNTIKNCTFNMQRINNASGTGTMVDGSTGILIINSSPATATTSITPSSAAGTNSYNKFYTNTVNGGNYGVVLSGYNAGTPFTAGDTENDIGGSSTETGNTIINFGGEGTYTSAGIIANNQWGINISHNTINNNNGTGINHTGGLRGIYAQAGTGASATITYNTITVKSGGTASYSYAIDNGIGSTGAGNTININNNTIQNCTYTDATTGYYRAIYNSATASSVNINGNTITGNSIGTSGTDNTCTFYGIWNNASLVNQLFSVSYNIITGNSLNNTNGTIYCVYANYQTVNFNGNIINNNTIPFGAGSSASVIYGYYNPSSLTSETCTNNVINNLTISGSSTRSTSIINGIYTGSSASSNLTVSGNNIYNLTYSNTSTGSAGIRGISITNGATENVYKNKIHSLSSDGPAATVYGLYINSGNTGNIYNNIIGNLATPSSNTAIPLAGINVANGTSMNIFYNTVYLNASSNGTLFGSSAIYVSTSPTINLRNNIFINTSTNAGATGFTTAYRRSSVLLTTYAATSNNNLFYSGAPGAKNLIMYNGTNSYQTIEAFKAAVGPSRDAASVTENTAFTSLTGTDALFLHINTAVQTVIESGGANITSYTDDFDGNIRQGNSGYTGTGTATDIGADEIEGTQKILSGDYTVGNAGDYATITAAMNDLNRYGINGPTRFLLTDGSYTINETYPISINITSTNLPTATNTVTIKPNSGVSAYVCGAPSSDPNLNPLFVIRNSYVSIDGSNTINGNTRDLSIENQSIVSPCVIGIHSSGAEAINNITIKNCIIINGSNSLNSANAIHFSDITYSSGYYNSFTIQNNNIQKSYTGISLYGVEATGNGGGTFITGNELNSSGSSSITGTGIMINGADGITVTNNNVRNMTNVDNTLLSGIRITTKTKNGNVSQNTISNIVSNSNSVAGISISGTNINVSNNSISDIKNTNTSGYTASGLTLSSTFTASNVTVSNNLIYDIAGYGNVSTATGNGYGIFITSGGGYNIYYNSVNLATDQTLGTGIPACLNISNSIITANTLDVRNNIFSIPATTGANRYAVLCNASSNVFSNINFNDYFTSDSNIGYIASKRANLSAWQSGTGKDQFSISGNPGFTSPTNLVPDPVNPNSWNINGGAYPISVVTSDYNNVQRRASLPGAANDIGAYEFIPSVSPAPASVNTNGNTTTVSSSDVLLATITWTSGTAPTLTAFYYPGEDAGNIPFGSKVGNSHLVINATGGSAYTYSITCKLNIAMLGTITEGNFNNARLAKYSSGFWQNYTPVPNGTDYTISVSGLTCFSEFVFCDNNAPLPVKLTSFTATVNNRNAELRWETAAETNNSGFYVERKAVNTSEWKAAGFVKGRGSSKVLNSYYFEDTKLNNGKYNYRLRQIDYNGNSEYHQLQVLIDIALPESFNISQNYPNPFNPVTNIDFDLPIDCRVSIGLYDISGRTIRTIINETRSAGYHTIHINASELSSGVYFYRFNATSTKLNYMVTKKMLLLK